MEEEWKTFQEKVVSGAKEVYCVKKLDGEERRKGSEWWDEEVKHLVRGRKKRGIQPILCREEVVDGEKCTRENVRKWKTR